MMNRAVFPFTAIVGQEAVKTALLLAAVDTAIGGVLVRGHKGTGKSTVARALAALFPPIRVVEGCPFNADPDLPGLDLPIAVAGVDPARPRRDASRAAPFVELPLNATEDRIAGTLHIESALASGERRFEPGLLARANRGVLYVDEVNLLDDHLVDLLLDAAASGVNVVERESVSVSHPARFVMIGTMNPEEGELRPQFLDRFGLSVDAGTIDEFDARERIVRRHLEFEADPQGFCAGFQAEEEALRRRVVDARALLASVQVGQRVLGGVVRLTHRAGAHGHRADLAIVRAARARAALDGRTEVAWHDVAEVARLALTHRLIRSPVDATVRLHERVCDALEFVGDPDDPPSAGPDEGADRDWDEMAESIQVPGAHAAGSIVFEEPDSKKNGTGA